MPDPTQSLLQRIIRENVRNPDQSTAAGAAGVRVVTDSSGTQHLVTSANAGLDGLIRQAQLSWESDRGNSLLRIERRYVPDKNPLPPPQPHLRRAFNPNPRPQVRAVGQELEGEGVLDQRQGGRQEGQGGWREDGQWVDGPKQGWEGEEQVGRNQVQEQQTQVPGQPQVQQPQQAQPSQPTQQQQVPAQKGRVQRPKARLDGYHPQLGYPVEMVWDGEGGVIPKYNQEQVRSWQESIVEFCDQMADEQGGGEEQAKAWQTAILEGFCDPLSQESIVECYDQMADPQGGGEEQATVTAWQTAVLDGFCDPFSGGGNEATAAEPAAPSTVPAPVIPVSGVDPNLRRNSSGARRRSNCAATTENEVAAAGSPPWQESVGGFLKDFDENRPPTWERVMDEQLVNRGAAGRFHGGMDRLDIASRDVAGRTRAKAEAGAQKERLSAILKLDAQEQVESAREDERKEIWSERPKNFKELEKKVHVEINRSLKTDAHYQYRAQKAALESRRRLGILLKERNVSCRVFRFHG